LGSFANVNGITLSDLFAKIYEWQKGGALTEADQAAIDQAMQRALPFSNAADPISGHGDISLSINSSYISAATLRPAPPPPVRVDPLAIDLDGDGIETVGIGSTGQPITFDHNADGVRTGSGWVSGDDAWLVLDRNANGTIDTGRELFGVDTLKANGQLATSGLDALRDLDTNLDGLFNASDAAFAQVQLWRDANQDGISQASELTSLAAQGIASISLSGTTATTNLNNGNTVGATTTVTRTDGTTTRAYDLNTAHNPFFRSFTTAVTPSATAQALPNMGGAGWVRDLREAITLSEQQSQQTISLPSFLTGGSAGSISSLSAYGAGVRPLATVVQEFASATTQAQQTALLDELIRAWAATNEFVALKPVDDPLRRFVVANDPAMSARLQAIIPVLEVFNGLGVAQAGMQNPTFSNLTLADGSTQQVTTYTLFPEQVQPMLNAYEQLRQSVYGALVMQTRLMPYLEAVELSISANGIAFDTSGITTLLQTRAATDPLNAVHDLLDLRRHGSATLQGVGWKFEDAFAATLSTAAISTDITNLLTANRLVWVGATSHSVTAAQAGFTVIGNELNNTITGNSAGAEILYGGAGNDTLIAVGNWDTLEGGAGNDTLSSSSAYNGSTTYIGGAGNDTITGTEYNDTYVFNRGDGADTITDWGFHSTASQQLDRLSFGAGIAAADIGAQRSGNDLIVTVAGQAGDQITIRNWFLDAGGYYRIEQVNFADGTTWGHNQLAQLALSTTNTGTEAANTLSGTTHYSDRLQGLAGNDTLIAVGNWDTLEGGAGNDTLSSSSAYNGSTTYIGGAGNDTITGTEYNDTYVFNRGDGADTITDWGFHSTASQQLDRLSFGAGIANGDLWFSRSGNHLVVQVLGDGGQITVNNWYTSSNYRLEELRLADGKRATAAQVDSLVQAMAAFAPPAPGQTSLTTEQQTALAPVLAASWV